MVGGGVLRECLENPQVESILAVGRKSCSVSHPKLKELLLPDISMLEESKENLVGFDASFFCLGVSSMGMSEADYRSITYDLTINVASFLGKMNPGFTFCYISAQGSDTTGNSRIMWARVRGALENQLLDMPFPAYSFRPGIIQPWKGVPSKSKGTRWLYILLKPFFPVLHLLFPNQITTTARIGRAMIRLAGNGYSKHILEIRDINRLANEMSLSSDELS